MDIEAFFINHQKIALGFSGGVDSVYLLYAAKQTGTDIQPYFIKTPFQPQFELEDAKKAASLIGANLKIIEYDILSKAVISQNPENRCYYCKKTLFSLLKKQAEADGYAIVIDGTNASDSFADRPGMKALLELGIKSPLKECGLTKSKIRELSKQAGLFTWDKPSYACLATRIQTGTQITSTLLNKIEKAEIELSKLGFSDFRLRLYSNAALLQVKPEQMETAVKMRKSIISSVESCFPVVFLDLKER